MNPVKIAAIILVIGAGIVGSYLIVKNPAAPLLPEQIESDSAQNFLIKNPIKWIENAVANLNNIGNEDSGAAKTTDNEDANNLTRLVAKAMFGKMRGLDEAGKNPFTEQGFNLNDEENQKLIQEIMAGIEESSGLFNPQAENKDLKISSDNSKEAKINYLNASGRIWQKHFSNPAFPRSDEQMVRDFDLNCLGGGKTVNSEVAGAYRNIAADYLNLNIPSDWLVIHKETIVYVKKGHLIFEAIAGCAADPIKGYLAGKALPEFATETKIIQKKLKEKVTEVGF